MGFTLQKIKLAVIRCTVPKVQKIQVVSHLKFLLQRCLEVAIVLLQVDHPVFYTDDYGSALHITVYFGCLHCVPLSPIQMFTYFRLKTPALDFSRKSALHLACLVQGADYVRHNSFLKLFWTPPQQICFQISCNT